MLYIIRSLYLDYVVTAGLILLCKFNLIMKICEFFLTLTLLYITKPHKNYLQNTQHVVLRNRPTLSIGTERLACLNNPRGVQLGTLA